MPITNNPYFGSNTSEDIKRGFASIASLFAPPSGSDLAGYANARESGAKADLEKQKLGQIAKLFDMSQNPDQFNQDTFDRGNAVIGTYAPTQSFHAVDVNAATDLAKNKNSVLGSTIGRLYGPLNPGQTRPAVPSNVASTIGLPEITAAAGLPATPSETEVKGGILQGLVNDHKLTDQQLVDLATGNKPREAPTGYQWAPDGKSLEFIPHGPADPSTAGKTTEATRRNQQLASVITPELHSLLGDGTPQNPGTFDALSNGWSQAADANIPFVGRPGRMLTSGEYQQAQNSLKTIVASYLYSVSGATANPGEVDNLVSVLTPQFGENPTSVAGKKARLQQMVEAVQAAATGAPFVADKPVPDASGSLPVGTVEDGYRFNGGDPGDQNNWSPVGGP